MNPRKYFRNNVESALRMVDAVLASNVRLLVFSSTCAVYGVPEHFPIKEFFPRSPINPYGATKLFFEQVLSAYQHSHGLKFVCLRYFNAAGAHSTGEIGEYHFPETHLIPLAMKAILGTAPPLVIFGNDMPTDDGTCIRDYIHVSDLGRAHAKALDYLANGGGSLTLNLGTGKGTSIGFLITALSSLNRQRGSARVWSPERRRSPALYADPSLAQTIFNWVPEFDLESILETAWKWKTYGSPKLLTSTSIRR